MLLESTIVPLPSELVIPPAAYLASQGKMNLVMVIFSGAFGSLAGALVNYYLALKLGRPAFLLFVNKYGKVFLLSEKSLHKVEAFWEKYGGLSTFAGRLLPGIRHLIPIPAGFARMPVTAFSVYTFLGAGLWCAFLAIGGFFFGKSQAYLLKYLHRGSAVLILVTVLVVLLFLGRKVFNKDES